MHSLEFSFLDSAALIKTMLFDVAQDCLFDGASMQSFRDGVRCDGLALPPRALALLSRKCIRGPNGCKTVSEDVLQQLAVTIDPLNSQPAKKRRMEDTLKTIGSLFSIGKETYSLSVIPCFLDELGTLSLTLDEWNQLDNWLGSCMNTLPKSNFVRSTSNCSFASGQSGEDSVNALSVGSETCPQDSDTQASVSSGDVQCRILCQQQHRRIKLLESLLKKKNGTIKKKQMQLCSEKKKVLRLQQKLLKKQDIIDDARNQSSIALRVTRVADAKLIAKGNIFIEGETEMTGWLTPQGCLALALRRNLANLAATDLGLVILTDVSRWTVCRAEIKASACLVSSSRAFWQSWLEQISVSAEHANCESRSTSSCTIISHAQDGTNRAVFNKQKLQTMIMEGHFAVVSRSTPNTDQQWQSIRRLSDVLPILNGTGRATAEMSHKLLSSLGCPTWHSFGSLQDVHGEELFDELGHPAKPAFQNVKLPYLSKFIQK